MKLMPIQINKIKNIEHIQLRKITKVLCFLTSIVLLLSGCAHVEIKGAGVFREPVKYRSYQWGVATDNIKIPPGLYGKYADSVRKNGHDGSEITFRYLGKCGAQLSFTGIVIPIIPFWLPNRCESKGFDVGGFGTSLEIPPQLHYNSITYDPYIDDGSVKFRIEDFSAFKKAKDKKLIIHKRNLDGTIWSKELPFDWKIVIETSGGL